MEWLELSRSANWSRRSRRRAVNTRFTPAWANSTAIASPIPALAPVTNAHLPCHALRSMADAIASLPGRSGELFAHPRGKRIHRLLATEKLLDQLSAWPGPAGLKNGLAVAHRGWPVEQVGRIELAEEIEGNHFVEHVSVVVRRVANQVSEARVHSIAVHPLVGHHALVAFFE